MSSKCKGIFLLVVGVFFFLGTMNVVPEFTFMKYWPLVLILKGLHDLMCKACMGGACAGGSCMKCEEDCGGKCDMDMKKMKK